MRCVGFFQLKQFELPRNWQSFPPYRKLRLTAPAQGDRAPQRMLQLAVLFFA